MLLLLLLAFFCYRTGVKAKKKGLNVMAWVVYTILSFFGGLFIGSIIVSLILISRHGYLSQQDILKMMESGALDINLWFVFLCSIGGYLFIRYRIDKQQPANNNDR